MTTPGRASSFPLLIVGSVALDDLELPTMHATDVVGGAATYAAIAATLFVPARVVAVVGRDFPVSALEKLKERGVDTLGMTVADGQTFRWKGRYAADLSSRETLDTQLNVFASFRPELPTTYRDSRLVLLGNIHPELQLRVLDQVSEPWLVAADTMNYWIDGTRAELLEVLRRIDTLIINDEEVRQLAGIHNLRRAAKAVLELGPRRLIVKRGEHGAMLFDDHGMFFAPAYPTDTEVDPTGAGDTFAGALLGYLASQGPAGINRFRLGLLYASAVAAFCVEGVGTRRLESVRADQVAQRVKELETLVSFR